jgi:glutaredoxin
MLNSKNKIMVISVLLFLTVIAAVFFLSSKKPKINLDNINPPSGNTNNIGTGNDVVFYYGSSCPHCLKVESFMDNNEFPLKKVLVRKEVFDNQVNAEEMARRAEQCGINKESLGVPFFWYKGKCLVGDEDIIKFFQSTTN